MNNEELMAVLVFTDSANAYVATSVQQLLTGLNDARQAAEITIYDLANEEHWPCFEQYSVVALPTVVMTLSEGRVRRGIGEDGSLRLIGIDTHDHLNAAIAVSGAPE